VTTQDHHLPTALPLTAACVSGALVAVQQRINGDLGTSLHDPLLAAVVSFVTGLVAVTVLLLLRKGSRAQLRVLRDIPWWTRLGGLGGATLVAVGATAAPKIGVALLTVGLVAGSTIGGLLVDRIGLAPGGVRGITGPRALGAVLCLLAIGISAAEGVRSSSPFLLGLVVLAGGLISFQQAVNGRVRHATDALVATFVNFVVGTCGLLLGLLLREVLVGVRADAWPDLAHAYLYLGGPIGAGFVAVAALVVRPLGVLRLGLAVTAGQLLGGVLIDLDRGVAVATLAAGVLTMAAVAVSGRGARPA
jgi:transporter family-2 protein